MSKSVKFLHLAVNFQKTVTIFKKLLLWDLFHSKMYDFYINQCYTRIVKADRVRTFTENSLKPVKYNIIS